MLFLQHTPAGAARGRESFHGASGKMMVSRKPYEIIVKTTILVSSDHARLALLELGGFESDMIPINMKSAWV